MKKSTRFLAFTCALLLALLALAGCGGSGGKSTPGNTPSGNTSPGGVDLSKEVHLVYYLWGGEGVANKDIIALINEKLKKDLNCTIEVKYIDWGDVGTKYPLLLTSGEEFDMIHVSPTASPSYYTLASQGLLTDITPMLDFVPTLRDEISEKTWAGAKYDGKIFAVPSLYSEFTPDGYAYRDDLREKYNLEPITSFETLEAYMDAIAENEDFYPLNGNSSDSLGLYRMFTDSTKDWIFAPGVGYDSMYLVAESQKEYKNILHPAFTEEFEAWCNKMQEWADKGYWPSDVMASEIGGKDNTLSGLSAGFIAHMPDWTGSYGSYKDRLPGIEINWWSPAVDNNKIINKPGVDNSTGISTTSKNPERALMVIEKFMTDQEYYRLIQYGIEGRQYEIIDGMSSQPAGYDNDKDAGGFAVWSLRNDRLNIPYASEDPRRYVLINEWKNTAIESPYVGFTFDPSNVSNEISAVANVNASLGKQLMFGKTTGVKAALEEYRQALLTAGIEKIIQELEGQLEGWTPIA